MTFNEIVEILEIPTMVRNGEFGKNLQATFEKYTEAESFREICYSEGVKTNSPVRNFEEFVYTVEERIF